MNFKSHFFSDVGQFTLGYYSYVLWVLLEYGKCPSLVCSWDHNEGRVWRWVWSKGRQRQWGGRRRGRGHFKPLAQFGVTARSHWKMVSSFCSDKYIFLILCTFVKKFVKYKQIKLLLNCHYIFLLWQFYINFIWSLIETKRQIKIYKQLLQLIRLE